MLSVQLTITNNTKAAKLLDLLRELPFVEIQECREMDLLDLAHLSDLYHKHQAHRDLAAVHIEVPGSQTDFAISKLIYDTVRKTPGIARLIPSFQLLAADYMPPISISLPDVKGRVYCLYHNNLRLLYSVGQNIHGRTNIWLIHLLDLS